MSRNGSTRRPPIPAADFVRAWQAATSTADALERLTDIAEIGNYHKPDYNVALSRAHYFRRKGVRLKRHGGRGSPLDVAALNKIAGRAARGK
jgi:hypothetical protein